MPISNPHTCCEQAIHGYEKLGPRYRLWYMRLAQMVGDAVRFAELYQKSSKECRPSWVWGRGPHNQDLREILLDYVILEGSEQLS